MTFEQDLPENEHKELVLRRGRSYIKLQEDINKVLSTNSSSLRTEYTEGIRNLAIVAGAIATFSLMLQETFQGILLIIGIVLLLTVVILSFSHLFSLIYKNSEELRKIKRDALVPASKMSKSGIDFLRGRKTYEQWLDGENEFVQIKYDFISAKLAELSSKDKPDYTSDVIVALFVIANSFIILAILLPATQPHLSDYLYNTFFTKGF